MCARGKAKLPRCLRVSCAWFPITLPTPYCVGQLYVGHKDRNISLSLETPVLEGLVICNKNCSKAR